MGKPTGFLEYDRKVSSSVEPTERIKNFNEFHKHLSEEEQRIQSARCMDCGVPFCQSGKMLRGMVSGCPLNNLIPEWNDLVYNGQWEEATSRLLLTNSFPEFTSRVCPALCEKACTCGLNGDAVTVHENEYAIIEKAFSTGLMKPKAPSFRTKKKVAVIGSGPSGLATAQQLNKRGHYVTVYERSDRLGGLLMYGIPNMKLDKSIVERRIELMKAEGIKFITNANVGENISAEDIIKEYDAVVLACGSSNPRDINVTGRDAKNIYFAVDFLKSTTKCLLDFGGLIDNQYISAKDKNVVVIGGGDTGNDCVGTVIRHGCKSVIQLEMMPKLPDTRADNNPWPEWPRVSKTDYGQEEAIALFGHDPRVYETTVKEFYKNNETGELCGLQTVKVHFVTEDGKRVLKEVEGSEQFIEADMVLIAAGFLGSQKYVTDAFGVEVNPRTNVATAPDSYATNVPKIFTAGDMHRGQSLVVWAIQEGRSVAKEVDTYIMGYSNLR